MKHYYQVIDSWYVVFSPQGKFLAQFSTLIEAKIFIRKEERNDNLISVYRSEMRRRAA